MMNKAMLVAILMTMLLGSAFSENENSILKNGSFDQGISTFWTIQYWSDPPSDGSGADTISEVSEDGVNGVEIKAFPEQFLYQDVEIAHGINGPYVLRWKAKGTGVGEAAVYPRRDSGDFIGGLKKFNAEEQFASYELNVDIPDNCRFVRVILQTTDSVVIFSNVELVPAESAN